MSQPVPMVEVWRGGRVESLHSGHAVVCGPGGEVVASWGDPGAVIFPRSSCKMVQALPLVESGHADGLTDRHLAIACASHSGAAMHVDFVSRWLADIGLSEADLRCGAHEPSDRPERDRLVRTGEMPCQLHNNCSGKHAGFLHLTRTLGGGPEYVDPGHPLQQAIRRCFEEVTGEASPGFGIDGCSAPNFATTVTGLARAMAAFARPGTDRRGQAMARLVGAITKHPEFVAGEGRASTELMRATGGRVALKSGAEGVFIGILPERGLGFALKVCDGASRAAEAAAVALLAHFGALDPALPAARRRLGGETRNWRGLVTGHTLAAPGFP